MEGAELNEWEWQLLAGYADDRQHQDADICSLAKLERLGLLMRGWNDTHVVTERGRAWLERHAAGMA
jgi:hypothetical protein